MNCVDPRYLQQDPTHQRWLKNYCDTPRGIQYYLANASDCCLTFEADLVDDERPLLQWMMDRGALPIVDPKRNYWQGKAVVWFPNQRSRWYAIQTAGRYLTRDWWWLHTFDTEWEEA